VTHPGAGPGPILSIDPGREKCGLAVVRQDGCVLHRAIVAAAQIAPTVADLAVRFDVSAVVIGNGTAAHDVTRGLAAVHLPVTPVLVDERHSSEQGRRRYFQENPPRGWRRLLPVSLQTPPRPYDDYVAVVLAERYLALGRQ